MTSFGRNFQNPSIFCCLVLFSLANLVIPKFEFERDSKMNSGSCSQMMYKAVHNLAHVR